MSEAKPFCISKWEVWEAYKRVKANQGAAGVDDETIADFERNLKGNLYKIWNRMSSGSYFPPPVRTVKIPKANGGETVRQFLTRRCERCGQRFEAGTCTYAVTSQSRICRGCSIRSFAGGSNTTDAFTGRRSIRRCGNWIDRWPAGPIGNTRSCAGICAGRLTGSRVSRDAIRSCGRTGRWVCGVAPWREPCERRRSSTVLREPRGEIPRGYSP